MCSFLVCTVFFSLSAFADYTWTWTIGCPGNGTSSPVSTWTATTTTGYTGRGTCQRVATKFTQFTVTSLTTPAPQSSVFYGHQAGEILLLPPFLPYETKPIAAVSSACPIENKSLNWIYFQWKQSDRFNLDGLNLMGQVTYSTSTDMTLDTAYDVDGDLNLTGPISLPGSCASGTYTLTGSGDRGGTVNFAQNGAGYFVTLTEKKFFFLPEYTITAASDLGSKTMQGYAFNSAVSTSQKAVRMIANAAGTSWTVQAYSDVANDTLDGSYTDTITITGVNTPQDGMMVGNVVRVGTNAGSGSVACIMSKTNATRIFCSAESPEDNTIPYSYAFGLEGPQVLGQSSGTSAAVASGFNTSEGVFSDGTHLLVADTSNNRVLIWNTIPATNQVDPDLVLGQPDMSSSLANNGGRTATSLRTPRAVYSDGTKVFVADSGNHRVLIWNTFPTTNAQAADLVLGQTLMTSATANQGGIGLSTLNNPYSVYGDGTKLYVTDASNHRILIWNTIPTSNKASASVVVGQPNATSSTANNGGISAATLSGPRDVRSDGTKLYVTDLSNNRILIWNAIPAADGASADVVVGQPNMTSATANNGGRSAATVSAPRGIHADGSRLYISDTSNNRILVYTTVPATNGASANLVLGQPSMASATSNNGGRSAQSLSSPRAVHGDGSYLYVVDTSNYRLLMWTPEPASNQEAADLVQGQSDMSSGTANDSRTAANTMNSPQSVFSDGTHLLVADNVSNRVLIWNTMPEENNVSANVVLGQPAMDESAANNGGISASTMSGPTAVYSTGTQVFVADTGNHRVLVWTTFPTTNGQAADLVLGQPSMASATANQGGRSSQTFNAPNGLHSDGTQLYVADTSNNRVLIWTTLPTTNREAADLVLGQPSMAAATANNGGRSNISLSAPRDVFTTGSKLFVVDSSNNRALIWDTIPAANRPAADWVIGQPDMSSGTANNGSRSASTLSTPYGVSSDGSSLVIGDSANQRLLLFNAIPAANQASADAVFGQPTFTSATANNGGLSTSTLSTPRRVYMNGSIIMTADSANNRVITFDKP